MKYNESLYLDLIKKCLTNWIYGNQEYVFERPLGFIENKIFNKLASRGLRVVRPKPFEKEARQKGLDWPPYAHTMIGMERLNNLQYCIEDILANEIPGDLIETGVWRGGSTIFMRAILKARDIQNRYVWVSDSFEGLPKPDPEKYPEDEGDTHHTFRELCVSLEDVQSNFELYDLLDDKVRFLKGWFKDTLPNAPIDKLALIRLDGDMYESTIDAISSLYPKLSIGGYVIVDDYCIPSCRKAIHDYRTKYNINDEIVHIDGVGVFWKRTS